jgi:uncharacterized protein (TIGR02300 family)
LSKGSLIEVGRSCRRGVFGASAAAECHAVQYLLLTGRDGCGNGAPAILKQRRFPQGATVAKPEWGSKRICPSCGTRYYDMMRDPVVCPKCGTPFDPEAFIKARRARPAAPVERELEPVGAEDIDPDIEVEEPEAAEEEEEEGVPLEEAEEEEEELIEDASELGEDEDDMAEVIDNVEEEEP